MSTENKNIYQKLSVIHEAIQGLSKDKKGFDYKYVAGDKILKLVKPLMIKEGLLLKQEILSIENETIDYTTSKSVDKKEVLSKVMMRFTWVDIATGETDVNLFGANGFNGYDKGVGSALTYAERYFLLKYFHIPTDEDDVDARFYEDDEKEQKSSNPQKVTKPNTQSPVNKEAILIEISKAIDEKSITDIWKKYIEAHGEAEMNKKDIVKIFSDRKSEVVK